MKRCKPVAAVGGHFPHLVQPQLPSFPPPALANDLAALRGEGQRSRVNFVGMKIGKLAVKRFIAATVDEPAQYGCLCDCGRYVLVHGTALRCGTRKHCGLCARPAQTRPTSMGRTLRAATSEPLREAIAASTFAGVVFPTSAIAFPIRESTLARSLREAREALVEQLRQADAARDAR